MELPLNFKPVVSSQIDSIAYSTYKLFVKFKNGTIYSYEGVPHHLYEQMKTAESVGKFLNQHIKGVYQYEKIG